MKSQSNAGFRNVFFYTVDRAVRLTITYTHAFFPEHLKSKAKCSESMLIKKMRKKILQIYIELVDFLNFGKSQKRYRCPDFIASASGCETQFSGEIVANRKSLCAPVCMCVCEHEDSKMQQATALKFGIWSLN